MGDSGAALLAIGGYGRGTLSPHSDLDLLFLTRRGTDVEDHTLKTVLYPMWDAGFQIGHVVTDARGIMARAATDLAGATAVLTCRFLAGDPALLEELLERRERFIAKRRSQLVRELVRSTKERHARVDRAGWMLAPHIKEDAGGLRDLHTISWIVQIAGEGEPSAEAQAAGSVLLGVREALHGLLPRRGDRLRSDLQPKVAAALGAAGPDAADALMARVHQAARRIELEIGRTLESVREQPRPRRSGSSSTVAEGVRLQDSVLVLAPAVVPGPQVALELVAAHAATGKPVSQRAFEAAAGAFHRAADLRWTPRMTAAFCALLQSTHALAGLEMLEHLGAWPVLIPEWQPLRGQIQHDPWHRHTVDGHSFMTVVEVARAVQDDPTARTAAEEVGELHTLHVAALLHDSGKGSGRDHCEAGEEIARGVATRMGFSAPECEEVAMLVRDHLLLADTATRRDISDGAVVETVARKVENPRRLRLLYLLTAADGRATGPSSWSVWKRTLVTELYMRVLQALQGRRPSAGGLLHERARDVGLYDPRLAEHAEELLGSLPMSFLGSGDVPQLADDLQLLLRPLGRREVACRITPGDERLTTSLTICFRDRPGALASAAGVMTLHRLSVLSAQAFSTTNGMALDRFTLSHPAGFGWPALEADLDAAFSGRLALEARVGRKISDYPAPAPVEPDIRVLQEESRHSTVIEVRAPDALGLLYAVTLALADLEIDIHVAKIDTRGERVVDVFYIRSAAGGKLDARQEAEAEAAISHRVARLLGSPRVKERASAP